MLHTLVDSFPMESEFCGLSEAAVTVQRAKQKRGKTLVVKEGQQ